MLILLICGAFFVATYSTPDATIADIEAPTSPTVVLDYAAPNDDVIDLTVPPCTMPVVATGVASSHGYPSTSAALAVSAQVRARES